MDASIYKQIVQSQFDAALDMLEACIRLCPARHWKGIIGKYPFWLVAYHTLYCTDGYTARTHQEWKPHPKFLPGGISDVMNEYPSRLMTKRELIAYLALCRKRMRAAVRAETQASLRGSAGFPWLKFTRAEIYPYSLRHVQHHAGQLGAYLRRAKVATKWAHSGPTSPKVLAKSKVSAKKG